MLHSADHKEYFIFWPLIRCRKTLKVNIMRHSILVLISSKRIRITFVSHSGPCIHTISPFFSIFVLSCLFLTFRRLLIISMISNLLNKQRFLYSRKTNVNFWSPRELFELLILSKCKYSIDWIVKSKCVQMSNWPLCFVRDFLLCHYSCFFFFLHFYLRTYVIRFGLVNKSLTIVKTVHIQDIRSVSNIVSPLNG